MRTSIRKRGWFCLIILGLFGLLIFEGVQGWLSILWEKPFFTGMIIVGVVAFFMGYKIRDKNVR